MDNFKTQYQYQITIGNEANLQLLNAKVKSRFFRDLANIWEYTTRVLEG